MSSVVEPLAPAPGARSRSLLVFLGGQTVSFAGSEVTAFALPLVGVLTLNAGAAQMGLLTAAGLLPHALSPLFAGPIVDRSAKRPVMIATDLARAVLLLAVPALFGLHALTLPVLAVLAFVIGLLSVLFDTSCFAFLPLLVPEAGLMRANGRLEAARSAAQTVGPAGAGVLVQLFGAPIALVADAVSFLVSAVTVRATRVTDPRPAASGDGGVRGYLSSVAAGFTAVLGRPVLRLLGLGSGAFNLCAAVSLTVTALYVLRLLGLSAVVYGVAIAVGCLGGVFAGMVAERITDRVGVPWTFCGGLLVASVADVLLVLARPHTVAAVAILVGSQLVATFGATLYVATNAALRQRLVPADLRGRVYATMRLLNRSSMPVGALLGGWLAMGTSPRIALLVAGLGQILTAAVFTSLRRLLPPGLTPGRTATERGR
ncbi:MAG TPA: MFS transporter [Pseudonocardiaceae bacterium]